MHTFNNAMTKRYKDAKKMLWPLSFSDEVRLWGTQMAHWVKRYKVNHIGKNNY